MAEHNVSLMQDKQTRLRQYVKELKTVAVAFSGGIDSVFLLKTAHEVLGDGVMAITAVFHSFPQKELEEAESFCKKEGIRQRICRVNELELENFCQNPPNRCYICKKAFLQKIKEMAAEEGIVNVAEGSNMDDCQDYRPGMAAVSELKILSPLRELGLYKSEIRQLSKQMGLSAWEKPSSACLASRFAYGEQITEEKLRMVEQAEQLLSRKGFGQFRVRIHDRIARIEVLPEEFAKLFEEELRQELVDQLKSYGFTYVSMDLEGYRTGSMNEALSKGQEE